MKKALIIAYDFPPARTGGVYRPVKFAKYLPEFGYQPVILTVKNYSTGVRDETLLDELPPNTPIYRSYSFELERFREWVKRLIMRQNPETAPAAPVASAATPTSDSEVYVPPKLSLIKRLVILPINRFIENFIHSPDTKVGWIPAAVFKGLRVIRREKIDIIFSTSPPETNHIVGYRLSRLTGKPLVVDFRDPWTTHYTRQDLPKFKLNRERRLERKILKHARSIIHTGNGRAELVRAAFEEIPADKHHVITNGYDEGNFAGFVPEEVYKENKTAYLNLVNIGYIYPDTAFDYFLQAFERIMNNPEVSSDIRITIVGELSDVLERRLSNPPYKDFVDILGFKPHNEAVRQMAKSDVLLLLLPEGDRRMRDKIIAGRTFEFMRSGRPILMIGWAGESSQIIERSGLGKFVSYEDIDQMERVILDYYKKKKNDQLTLPSDREYIRQFDRRLLTGRLAGLFDSACGN